MNQFGGDSDVSLADDPLFNPKYEEQFILRVPPRIAKKMENESVVASIEFFWQDERRGFMIVDGEKLSMRLADLPCVIETHKTADRVGFFKTGDVGQMIIVDVSQKKEQKLLAPNYKLYSGITPPTANVSSRVWAEREIVNLKVAEIETIRITKGGISNDVELTVVDPSEVAHLPDFSEEIIRDEAPSTPGSPFSAASPFPSFKGSPSPLSFPRNSISEDTSTTEDKPPVKRQKISETASKPRKKKPKQKDESPKKPATQRKRAPKKPKASVTNSDVSMTEAGSESMSEVVETSGSLAGGNIMTDTSTDATGGTSTDGVDGQAALLKKKSGLEAEIKELEQAANTAQQNHQRAENNTIKQRYQALVEKKKEEIQQKQAELALVLKSLG